MRTLCCVGQRNNVCSTFSITETTAQVTEADKSALEELEKKEGYVCLPCGHNCLKPFLRNPEHVMRVLCMYYM